MEQRIHQLEPLHNSQRESRIAEVSIPEGAHAARYLLAGMLRELNAVEDSRWVCWVGDSPVKPLIGAAPRQSGEHILQVVCRPTDVVSVAERALRGGRSHTVVILINKRVCGGDRKRLEAAAAEGDADCLLVDVRQ